MFAIGLWDRRAQSLWLIRDRLGVKPLYYAYAGNRLLFGSELKTLRAHPDWKPTIDTDALSAYMRHGYVPAPYTIYKEARKLNAGEILEWHAGSEPRTSVYWNAREKAIAGRARWGDSLAPSDAIDQLDLLLRDAVKRRMIADVPLGAFLSGGIDSSAVTALMQAQSIRPVKTFSIGFSEAGYDEAKHAKAVAAHLGTDHTELYVTPEHALSVVPRLSEWYDEPFADSSQIPTFLVSEITRRHVTVALSGDGGDESFAGYSRYLLGEKIWNSLDLLPASVRKIAAAGIAAAGTTGIASIANALLPATRRMARPAETAAKLAQVMRLGNFASVYRRLVSQWEEPDALVRHGREPRGALWDDTLAADIPETVARMQLLDTITYLPDDILTKVDRASMAVGLEARVPLLDHRVVELAWTMRPDLKIRDGESKWVLRRVLERYVPRALFERPKMGFGVPIDAWLRGPLRDWAEDLLDPKAISADGLLDPLPITEAWTAHKSGLRNMHYPIWVVLMLRDWQKRWM
jgi:asparagine synthase (glutamine-hydrolysing)